MRWEDGEILTPVIVGFRDVYSGMPVSHRIGRTENRKTGSPGAGRCGRKLGHPGARLFRQWRGFMSKWLTGGMNFRFRFKVKQEEPQGDGNWA